MELFSLYTVRLVSDVYTIDDTYVVPLTYTADVRPYIGEVQLSLNILTGIIDGFVIV